MKEGLQGKEELSTLPDYAGPTAVLTPPEVSEIAQPSRWRKAAIIMSVPGLLLLILAIVLIPKSSNSTIGNGHATVAPIEAGVVVMRYYLDVELPGQPNRIKDIVPVEGQEFRFHFIPSTRGYLYIIAEGAKNALTTYLTGQSIGGSCLKPNILEAGADYVFPPESCKSGLKLGSIGTRTAFKVILSSAPITTPAFLTLPAPHELTPDEQRELYTFSEQVKMSAATLTSTTENDQRSVIVRTPKAGGDGQPVGFEIRLAAKDTRTQ